MTERKAEQMCRQCEWEAEGEMIDTRHHECADVPTESEPEREKCPQFYCPNQPAWIPAGQNGCPHCGGTATRGFCICETATADEIRDMYTPPASETPHDDGCGGCDLGICTPPETPSPEVGMRTDCIEAAVRDVLARYSKFVLLHERPELLTDAIRAAAKETK